MQPLSHALQAWKSSNTALLTVAIFRGSLFAHIIIYRKYIATRLTLPRWLNIIIKHFFYTKVSTVRTTRVHGFFLTHWIQISWPINIRTNPKSVLKAALIFLKNMFEDVTKITEIYQKRVNLHFSSLCLFGHLFTHAYRIQTEGSSDPPWQQNVAHR